MVMDDPSDFTWRVVAMVLAFVLPAIILIVVQRWRRSRRARLPSPAPPPPPAAAPLPEERWGAESEGPRTEEAPAEGATVATESAEVEDAVARLARLEQLRKEGLITEEEYLAQRKETLKSL